MLITGLTGNIGSGKTTVAGIFGAIGIPVYYADEESKKILDDPEVKNEIVGLFGSGIIAADSRINRKALASVVFNNKEELRRLNSVLHPRVKEHFRDWKLKQQAPYIIQESAIIYENNIAAEYDRIIHVSCPKEIAINRVIKRDGVDGNSTLKRMQFQITDEEKSAFADYVIINDGKQLVIPQVLNIHWKLLQISA
ncbi:MAG: dephospho-CoA kinase [Bacteroidetes bacterium]|nr:dephospho-CoA kinase [Bacteroidota bacterium]